ncbi:MAG: hypothetical protein GX417_12260 [Clostridiales bacterium]|nr:hypothetical protein [Clostridiales bacterium]
MKKTAAVDRQASSLLDITFWSNIFVILVLVGINAFNIARAGTEQGALITAASPVLVLIASLALAVWMGYACVDAMKTKRWLIKVGITLDESGVSGYALENPSLGKAGEPFSLRYSELRHVGVVEAAITKKHSFPSLKLSTADRSYIIPAPDGLDELIREISDRMTGA